MLGLTRELKMSQENNNSSCYHRLSIEPVRMNKIVTETNLCRPQTFPKIQALCH